MRGAAVLVAAAATATASAASEKHGTHHAAEAPPLLDEASACVRIGELCLDHCFQTLAAGDPSIAACGRIVHEMIAVSAALETLAAAGSLRLPALARAAVPVYETCEKECRKHESKHAICGKCGDACVTILKAIAGLAVT